MDALPLPGAPDLRPENRGEEACRQYEGHHDSGHERPVPKDRGVIRHQSWHEAVHSVEVGPQDNLQDRRFNADRADSQKSQDQRGGLMPDVTMPGWIGRERFPGDVGTSGGGTGKVRILGGPRGSSAARMYPACGISDPPVEGRSALRTPSRSVMAPETVSR